jgi:hypothetical protein
MKKSFFALLFVSLSICAGAQDKQLHGSLEDLKVDFMMRGYFHAGSRIEDKQALGGFGTSQNFPKAIDAKMSVSQGEISLIATPDEAAVFAEKYKGLKVVLVNGTNERVGFPASDSRLSIVQEALDRGGKWKPIEYLPSSWCGNSYHTVFLGPNEYWEFAAARYTGKFKTRLRFRLDWQKSGTEKITIYSNEFEGGVNAHQFTIQQGHKPTSIMDPYNN